MFEAPEYSQEGIQEFRRSLDDKERTRKLQFYGAFDGDELIGVLCMREPQHIGGFFVKPDYHRKGIGRDMFETMRKDYAEQTVNGIRFTPMRFQNCKREPSMKNT